MELEHTINNQHIVIDLVKQNNFQIQKSYDIKNKIYRDVAAFSEGVKNLIPSSKPKKSVEYSTVFKESEQQMFSFNNLVEPKQILHEESSKLRRRLACCTE